MFNQLTTQLIAISFSCVHIYIYDIYNSLISTFFSARIISAPSLLGSVPQNLHLSQFPQFLNTKCLMYAFRYFFKPLHPKLYMGLQYTEVKTFH